MKVQTPPVAPVPVVSLSPEPPKDGELDLGSLFSILKRQALLILGVTAAVTTAAGIRAYLSPPTYSAFFEILVQPQSPESEIVTTIGGSSDRRLLLSDRVRVLTSPRVLQPVVDDLRAQGVGGCIPPEQAALRGLSEEQANFQCYARLRRNLTTEAGARNSRMVKVTYRGSSRNDVGYISERLEETILNYGLESRKNDLQLGLDFLNDKIPEYRERVDTLQADLQNLRQTYSLIDPSAQGGRIASQINTFEGQYRSTLIQLEESVTRYENLQRELAQRPQGLSASSVLSGNSRYSSLINQLLSLDARIAEQSTLHLDSSPDMQVLQEQRQNILNLLDREAEIAQRELMGEIEILSTREAALSETLANLDVNVDELASVTRQFTDLERELTIASQNLNDLLSRRETLQVEAAQRELPWQLITPASVSTQIANLKNNLVVGGLLGLLLGSGLAVLLDSQRGILYTSKDLKRLSPVPILGTIPHNMAVEQGYDEQALLSLYQPIGAALGAGAAAAGHGSNGRGPNGKAPRKGAVPTEDIFAYREAFRSLVANLQRLDAERPLKSLVISSADNQLADSTTAAYLAWAAAELGNRVLLIDADFRFPHLHTFLELPNQKGFSNILTGEADLKSAVRRSPLEPNLFTLTNGTSTVDPARLLSTSQMKQFVAKTEGYFDLVVYDSPPFAEYADAALLSAETDGLVLVSQLGTVKSAQLEQALEKLWISKIPLVGLIAKEAATKLALLPV